jgi:2-iminobutanoate/2-iminopropanoate deaminase
VKADEWVVISGQGPITAAGMVSGETLEDQTRLTIQNCIRQLESAGVTLADVFRVNVYLSDLSKWTAFNEIYQTYFTPPYPVRTAIQAVLWGGIQVEIDMMAVSQR